MKLFVLIVMILFSQITIQNELRDIVYSSYHGKLANLNEDTIEIYNDDLIQLEIPELINPNLDLNTIYVIHFRYDKRINQGIVDSIIEDTGPIYVIEDFNGLDTTYGNSYLQVLNLLNDYEFEFVNYDVVNVHETTDKELELAKNIYSPKRFVGESNEYWTYEIGYKVDSTSNYIAIVVRKDAKGAIGKTEIGFIHFPNDN